MKRQCSQEWSGYSGGRLLFLGNIGLSGDNNLNNNGRFVGIATRPYDISKMAARRMRSPSTTVAAAFVSLHSHFVPWFVLYDAEPPSRV